MSAALAAGNLFWSLICLPLGIASMTGAFVAQYIGVGRPEAVGRLLWQAIFLSIATTPLWVIAWIFARQMFIGTGQASELLELETVYLRVLMFGAVGGIIESALSGFFSGTHRTMAVMWINVASALVNLVLDVPLIFDPHQGLFVQHINLASAKILIELELQEAAAPREAGRAELEVDDAQIRPSVVVVEL